MLGCACFNEFSPCSALAGNEAVFVGKVLESGGGSSGLGPARVLVEEGFHHAPNNEETVVIDAGAGSSCAYPLRVGDRYVIYAKRKEIAGRVVLKIEGCSNTFRVSGHEAAVAVLRDAARGVSTGIAGSVRYARDTPISDRGLAGAKVVVLSATRRYETESMADGSYAIHGAAPGRYQLEVTKLGYSSAARTIGGDLDRAGKLMVSDRSCAFLDVEMIRDRRISGTVTNRAGVPRKGVAVQAFQVDRVGARNSWWQSVSTNAEGKYVLTQLPEGEYVVGVNAEDGLDANPYARTLFAGNGGGSRVGLVKVGEGLSPGGIDLKLGDERLPATLLVKVVGPEGLPVKTSLVQLLSPDGAERWSLRATFAGGMADLPVFVGERYVVKVKYSIPIPPPSNQHRSFEGRSAEFEVLGRTSITVFAELIR